MSKDWINRLTIAYFLFLVELISIVALKLNPRDDSYYIVASVFNASIVLLLPHIVRVNLVKDFQYLNLAALIVQGFGFYCYWGDIQKIFYNCSIHALSIVQILRLLIIRKGDADGYSKSDHWRIVVHYYHFYLSKILFKKEKI